MAEVPDLILGRPLRVISLGIEDFALDLRDAGVSVIHLDWQPPAGGNQRLIALLVSQKRLAEAGLVLREAATRPSADLYRAGGVIEQVNVNAWKLRQAGQLEEAAALRQQIVEGARSALKRGDPRRIRYQLDYAELLIQMKPYDKSRSRQMSATCSVRRMAMANSSRSDVSGLLWAEAVRSL